MTYAFGRHALVVTLAVTLVPVGVSLSPPVSAQEQPAQDNEKSRDAGGVGDMVRARREARERRRQAREGGTESAAPTQAEARYPQAQRKEPETKATSKNSAKLKKMFDAYDQDDAATVLQIADEVIADGNANVYERSIAARIAGATQLNVDDARALAYLKRAVETNGLGNNDHYESMLLVSQLQLQADDYAGSLATVERFLSESGSQEPEHLVVKGNALYGLKRYPEAAAVLKQAVQASPQPKAEWMQLLMGAYADMDQPAEAAKIAEELSAKDPNDTGVQMNLASIYMQNEQPAKAAAILEKLRAGGALKTERDYRNLYALYANSQGKEKETIAVIEEGLQKGLLKPDFQTYNTQAQAYWFSDQPDKAIDAYRKAAPLAPDGETYLNLARALNNAGRPAEAKEAAKQALAKGVKKPEDANRIVGGK
jgi:tetratricopeptide (TPR) repeat protein